LWDARRKSGAENSAPQNLTGNVSSDDITVFDTVSCGVGEEKRGFRLTGIGLRTPRLKNKNNAKRRRF
jgi:hypothetical protein